MGWHFDSDRPIYVQLLELIQQRIITGTYGPGEQLPPVRELALEAGVNPNTMQKAMTELERTGLIHAQRTTGRFVTEDVQMIRDLRQQLALARIADFMHSMQELGYERTEILELMSQNSYDGACDEEGDKETEIEVGKEISKEADKETDKKVGERTETEKEEMR